MYRPTPIHSAIFALFAALAILVMVLAIALDTGAQPAVPPCPGITYMALVDETYTATKAKCWYAGHWDVFLGDPGYSPYFFCSRNAPEGTIVYSARATLTGDVKCVWMPGSETPEGHLSAPAFFRAFN